MDGSSQRTASTLEFLEGSRSGIRYDADHLRGTDPADGRTLLARYDLAAVRDRLTPDVIAGRRRGVWRWEELLPVRVRSFMTTLGEGGTPLLPPGRLSRKLGLDGLHMKAESTNPTGSFKARGMAVAVSRAVELGATHLVAPSAGNVAGALAAYASVAGVWATVGVPADAPLANQLEALTCGARLILLDGLISDCGKLARLVCEKPGGFDVATLCEPYRVEGKKTLGIELAEDFGWSLPHVVVYPTGGGTGLIGMWKAFEELQALGFIGSSRPRMFSVQSDGCAPIVRAFEQGAAFAEPWPRAATQAAGIRVPSALGDHLILECLGRSGGGAIAVPETEIVSMQVYAARNGAGYLSLESAAAFAALPIMREQGLIDMAERIVVFDTGAGFKSEPPSIEGPAVVANDPEAWDAVAETLAGAPASPNIIARS